MALPPDVKVTTEVLWRATLIFAPVDAVFLAVLTRRIDNRAFRALKSPMLRGASPVATVVFPIFEYILYWCITVSVAVLVRRLVRRRPISAQPPRPA